MKILTASILGGAILAACATTTPQGPGYPGPGYPGPSYPGTGQQPVIVKPGPTIPSPVEPTGPTEPTRSTTGLTPPFMNGKDVKRVALLLPFSARSSNLRTEANSMLRAAELSVFANDENNVLLMALDSRGTPEGATQATQTAIAQGADVIIGPIIASSVRASGKVARKAGIPVIGFSTDSRVAGGGVYLLSFPPEAEVSRITSFAAEAGASKFAYLGPTSTYGNRVLSAYTGKIKDLGGLLVGSESYSGDDISVMQAPAAKLAGMFPSPEETAENPDFDDPYHVVLMPEGGTALRSLAPLLTFYNENTRHVQIMGTGLWNREEAAQEPALAGGIFAGPDRDGKLVFERQYQAAYGEEASRLSSLAYDGVSIATFVAEGNPAERRTRLNDAAGFFGVDGFVRFNEQGLPQRGLAIYQIKNGRFVVIDPAPKSSDGAF